MNNNKDIKSPWWRDGVLIFSKVSAYIAVPIIIALYAGKFLDKKYNTGTLISFVLIAIAFISTIYLIWKETKNYQKKLEREEKLKHDN